MSVLLLILRKKYLKSMGRGGKLNKKKKKRRASGMAL